MACLTTVLVFLMLEKFLLKLLKDVGIGINFLIDYKELEFLQKVGEGGYGEVFLGKWLG
jgi:hypothetical protein